MRAGHGGELVPREVEEDCIFDLWGIAQYHIWRAWMVEADPANLQPKLRKNNYGTTLPPLGAVEGAKVVVATLGQNPF